MSAECSCGGSGWIRATEGDYATVRPCCCRLQKEKARMLGSMFALACFRSSARPHQAKAMERMRQEPLAGYFLHGPYGTGKTWLAAAQFDHAFLRDHLHTVWLTDVDLAAMSRDPRDIYLDQLIRRLREDPGLWHVFLDDLGKSRMSDWVRQDMYRLVNAVFVNRHRITVTSNYGLEILARDDDPLMPGGAIMRRIDDMVIKIQIG